jgi:hypothetical protein
MNTFIVDQIRTEASLGSADTYKVLTESKYLPRRVDFLRWGATDVSHLSERYNDGQTFIILS